MRDRNFQALKALPEEQHRTITYFQGKQRVEKTFQELAADIAAWNGKLKNILGKAAQPRVVILGPISYEWMLLDLACIQGGIFSIAPPEHLATPTLMELLTEAEPTLICVDFFLRDKVASSPWPVFHFNAPADDPQALNQVEATAIPLGEENPLLVDYSLAYSSGTSSTPKAIPLKFRKRRPSPFETARGLKKLLMIWQYKRSFWSRSDNKILLFMPFSHLQQRNFVLMALQQKINIVLSSPARSVEHLITEKPNIMVSVPVIYEALAQRIEHKLKGFSASQQFFFRLFLQLRINMLPRRNWIKKRFSNYLFSRIAPLYGGKADYFVTGSAPISTATLETFMKVGVRILEAYGQSESQVISMNSHRHFRIGSVGKPLGKVKIGADAEILVKYEPDFHEGPPLDVDEEGYIHTGDLGYLDKDGFLFLMGRKDDTIVLQNGKKVFPSQLEKQIQNHIGPRHVFVFSPDQKSLQAVVVAGGQTDLKSQLKAYNQQAADFERINAVHITGDPFSTENGLLTANLKLRRQACLETFAKASFTPLSSNS